LPLKVRLISAIDRCHYTVSPADGFINPPTTCSVETEADEQVATEIDGAHQRGFYLLAVFFFNEALLKLPQLFPLTD